MSRAANVLHACVVALFSTGLAAAQPSATDPPVRKGDVAMEDASAGAGLHFAPHPAINLVVASLGECFDRASVTDVEAIDFDCDGRMDLAVAWYATDVQDARNNLRALTLFRNTGTRFVEHAVIDLYIMDPQVPARSVFRNGTSDIAVGDFDGDGDADLVVTPFFGDEIWFIESFGNGTFQAHLRFPFDFNSAGFPLTPPECLTGDFDGDGRDELVYICDVINVWDGAPLHFWKTDGGIADIYRIGWQELPIGELVQWRRGLALADFDGDGRLDLCFSGSVNPPYEDDPVVAIWYGLDPVAGAFHTAYFYPETLVSDVIAQRLSGNRPPGILLCSLDGSAVHFWTSETTLTDYAPRSFLNGYAGLPPGWGMTGVLADIDGDGDLDLVTKQKGGSSTDRNQIEITLWDPATLSWTPVRPTPLDARGYPNDVTNPMLRPRNLAVVDLLGNTLPEIIAGYSMRSAPTREECTLDVAIWLNGCWGDVDRDGRTTPNDVRLVTDSLGTCHGQPMFNPDADLDKDGCITELDLDIVISHLGCDIH